MVRFLVFDYKLPITHKRINIKTISFLSKIGDVKVVSYEGYYDILKGKENVDVIDVDGSISKTNVIIRRFRYMHNIINAFKGINKLEYDIIFLTHFEIMTVLLVWIMQKEKKIYLQWHNQIDEFNSILKDVCFFVYKNKVHHIFFEREFADYLIQKKRIPDLNAHVIHNPLLSKKNNLCIKQEKTFDVLGISSGNDERIVEYVMKRQRKDNILGRLDIKVYLRSKVFFYEDSYLRIDNKFLSVDEYEMYFANCSIVLIIPPIEKYKHRISGTFSDAISQRKKIICVDFLAADILRKVAPSMFYILDDVCHVFELMKNVLKREIVPEEYNAIVKRHSDETIVEEYRNVFHDLVMPDDY